MWEQGILSLVADWQNIEIVSVGFHRRRLMANIEMQRPYDPNIFIIASMSDMIGTLDAILLIRKECPKSKIILLSAPVNSRIMARLVKFGINWHVSVSAEHWALKHAIMLMSAGASNERGAWEQNILLTNSTEADKILFFDDPKQWVTISQKEKLFMRYCCQDKSFVEISKELGLSERSLHNIAVEMYRKCEVNSRHHFVMNLLEYRVVNIF